MKIAVSSSGMDPMSKPSMTEVLTIFDPRDVRIRRFWLLALSAITASFVWLLSFCWAARLLPLASWRPGGFSRADGTSITNGSALEIPTTAWEGQSKNETLPSILPYIDISLGLLAGSTLDAIVVVANFNRPLTQQFHYVVSLRMTVLGILLSASLYFWNINPTRGVWDPPAIIGMIGTIYTVFILATDKLHKLFPTRYISAKKGLLFHHMRHLGVDDTPWRHSLLLLAMNFVLCLSLVMAVPPHWASFGPPVQIASEPIFLRLVGADKTARYNIIVAPLVLAHSALDWGLRQVVMAPRLSISPEKFLGLILANRLLMDLHLCTIFRHRGDLRWARREIVTSTPTVISILSVLFGLERSGIPIVTYIKPTLWVTPCVSSMLLHFLPSCYVIAFQHKKDIIA
ncbi:hypothetical protein BJX68DRAFT_256199 [Aspergillus pseudodeflectus]|uniref:Uncharacterized protein n=1 Tax=Aspergillus pseudodeflectus TaxID=176178 RepID=A0ABR4K892_9EURO